MLRSKTIYYNRLLYYKARNLDELVNRINQPSRSEVAKLKTQDTEPIQIGLYSNGCYVDKAMFLGYQDVKSEINKHANGENCFEETTVEKISFESEENDIFNKF